MIVAIPASLIALMIRQISRATSRREAFGSLHRG